MGSHGLPALLAAAGVGAASLAAVQLLLRRVARAQAAQHNGADADASSAGMPPLRGATPHPGWHPPLKQPAPFASNEMRAVDPSQLPSDVLYPLIISAIVPRPIGAPGLEGVAGRGAGDCVRSRQRAGLIQDARCCPAAGVALRESRARHPCPPPAPLRCAAFVSTQSAAGEGNLAPFSYFNVVAHAPPHVVIGEEAGRQAGRHE